MHIYAIVNNEFTYPKFMNQNDRDFQKVLQALTSFDKKLSNLETIVEKMAKANYNYATSQQELNKQQSLLNKDLGEAIKAFTCFCVLFIFKKLIKSSFGTF